MAMLDNSATKILASGLGYPEGPVHCNDGSIILVELMNQCLSIVPAGGGEAKKIADIPGSPNGVAVGKDGNLYICNSGGFEWIPVPMPPDNPKQTLHIGGLQPQDYESGKLQRYNVASAAVETLFERCTLHGPFGNLTPAGAWPKPLFPLCGPDDLVVDKLGGIWFSDFGKQRYSSKDVTGIYYVSPDGKHITQMAYPLNSSNGIALSPDGDRLYVALTYERRIVYYDIPEAGELAMNPANITDGSTTLTDRLPDHSMPDSMAVDRDGNVYVATMLPDGSNPATNGGISIIDTDGNVDYVPIKLPDGNFAPMPSNICFGGKDMKTAFITCGASGYLISMPAKVPGQKLNSGGSHFDTSTLKLT